MSIALATIIISGVADLIVVWSLALSARTMRLLRRERLRDQALTCHDGAVGSNGPVYATARDIEAVFAIPAGRIRAWAAEGAISHDGGRPAKYNVAAVLAERQRRHDTVLSWAG